MFIGHFALAFGAKPLVPRVSLAALFLAAQLADVLWPVLVLSGIERVQIVPGITAFMPLDFTSYPWSHSLVMLLVWGCCLGGVYRGIAGGRRSFVVLAVLVLSHWVLDWITHRPDMPLYPGGPKVGLGLWNSVPGTIVVETLMYAAGLYVYVRTTRARTIGGRWGLVGLAFALLIVYASSSIAGAPPSVRAIGIAGVLGAVVFTTWGWWVDRGREPAAPGRAWATAGSPQ